MAKKPTYEELEQKVRELERNSSRDGQSKNKSEMESVFKETINASVDAMVIADEDAKVLLWNPSAERIFGYKGREMIGRHFLDWLIPEENRERVIKKFGKAVKAGTLSHYRRLIPTEGLRKDGSRFPLEHTVSMFKTNGKLRFVAILRDVTAQERTATELTQLIDTANAPIFGVDVDGKINEWNQMVARITGYNKDEVEGKNLVKEYITDEYKTSVREVLDKALKGEETDNYEVPLFTKDGKRLMVLLNATTRRDADGNIVGVVGVGQDITELSEHRENLEGLVETRTGELNAALKDTEQARDKIDGILKSVADGLIVTDSYNRVILMNRPAEDLLGVHLSEVIDRPIDFAIKEKRLRDRVKETLDKKTTGDQFDFEQPGDDPEHPRVMRARTSVIHDYEDKEIGIVTILQDVTYEREVDRMKTDFLSIAAHELRTPMTSVLDSYKINPV